MPGRKSQNEYQNRRRRKLQAEGLCIRCRQPRNLYKSYCDECMEKERDRVRTKLGCKRTNQIRIDRPSPNPPCIHCGRATVRNGASRPGGSVKFRCKACRRKFVADPKRARPIRKVGVDIGVGYPNRSS